ncbi:MAG: hypothetical protein PHN89_04435 [Candidatus Pacebacteria bacterium]|nr:hypothetical protein [Candidatus Paceibacterota bacterium]
MTDEPFTAEICGIDTVKKTITIRKQNGKTWNYHYKRDIDVLTEATLEDRRLSGWDTLGHGNFERMGKVLHLVSVGL